MKVLVDRYCDGSPVNRDRSDLASGCDYGDGDGRPCTGHRLEIHVGSLLPGETGYTWPDDTGLEPVARRALGCIAEESA